jgi:hypothetical protein
VVASALPGCTTIEVIRHCADRHADDVDGPGAVFNVQNVHEFAPLDT